VKKNSLKEVAMNSKNSFLIIPIITFMACVFITGCITVTPREPESTPDTPPPGSNTIEEGPPVIVSFQSSAEEIALGESATLTWKVTDAIAVTIEPDVGNVAQSGSTAVSPTEATIYTLTATNPAGTATREVGVNIAGSVSPERIALQEADVTADGFVLVSSGTPQDIPGAVSSYSVKFKRGSEELVNTVASFPSEARALNYYILSQEQYRLADAWPIYTINEQKAYVIIIKGSADIPESDKYNIRFTKSNVFVELGYINNYKQLEDYARLIETRIK
jgi:hypothetical protein